MKKNLALLALLTFSLTFGKEVSPEKQNENYENLFSVSEDINRGSNDNYDILLDCYSIALSVLEAGLKSGMLINEAYDAAYVVMVTCEAIEMM